MQPNADLLAFVHNAFPDMSVTVEPWVKDRSAWRSRSSIPPLAPLYPLHAG